LEREKRKNEHLHYAAHLEGNFSDSGLKEVHLIPDALPELNLEEIDLHTSLGGLELPTPLIINAITGGTPDAKKVNYFLAQAAKICQMPIAVGSQTVALEKAELRETFQIVRKVSPHGLVFANLGADLSVEKALQAVEMLEADALQIHLNVAQELAMPEGDRDFRGYLENIGLIKEAVPVPVIVKEVGFGLSKETVSKLKKAGIKLVDIGGKGGTNFIAIEKARAASLLEGETFLNWGLPTAVSLLECLEEMQGEGEIIASGGLTNGWDLAKVLSLGAKAAGIAGLFLKTLMQAGEKSLIKSIEELKRDLKIAMLMVGAKDIPSLQEKPLVILGETAQWLKQRGIKTSKYARR